MENKIINYINQTPENTNPSVLATLLGELKVPKPLTYDYMPEGYPSKTMETTTLMEEQRLSFEYRENLYIATLPVSIDLVEGQTYVVTFDGIIYKCLCKLNRNVEYIGSDQNEYGGLVGDERFCVSNGLVAARYDDYLGQYTEHTIGITTVIETITPMSEEFMPVIPLDKLPTVPYLLINSSTPGSTKKFKITVDDSGAISATEVTS